MRQKYRRNVCVIIESWLTDNPSTEGNASIMIIVVKDNNS